MDRRSFLGMGSSCAACIGLAALRIPGLANRFASLYEREVEALEPWGRLEQVGDGVWAVVSTPLAGGANAMRTLANGGLVAGRDGVLVLEGFATAEGAGWITDLARELAGSPPSHVLLTHYHGDHSNGLAAYREHDPDVTYVTTETTRARLVQSARRSGRGQATVESLASATLVDPDRSLTLDLGGRTVRVTPRAGHTASDLVVTVDDPRVTYCGDLVWHELFPNYVDATPSVLSREVRALLAEPEEGVFVPGHGSIPDAAQLRAYIGLLDDLERAARRAFTDGTPADEAARDYRPPESLGDWVLFSPSYYRTALTAWERELAVGGERV